MAKQTRARVKITLHTSSGGVAGSHGSVKVVVGGRTYRTKLDDGRAVVRLRAFDRPGKRWVRASYWDSAREKRITETVAIRVRESG